ncbi:hypothetical protein PIB30_112929 [Stylosanthes scabra]|uniref:Aminotransferase-like plant mobile domain-containing protein n=1 Tax=Stylosanthes scabra TaxID=79078 RepID=A0ABU6W4M0_9FABA|nr:hypothetical protein [Stylosanthes scabra]
MPDGRGKPRWEWFEEIFGVMPPREAADACTLFGDKTAARVPLRWLPFVDQLDDLGQYSWGSATLAWLYRNLCRASNRNVGQIFADIGREGPEGIPVSDDA